MLWWLQAIHKYQRLGELLQGEQPRHLLPPTPRGYILSRVRALAEGPCVAAFTWNSGGDWAHKPWSNELPTDSALVFYLFAAFLEVCGDWITSQHNNSVFEFFISTHVLPIDSALIVYLFAAFVAVVILLSLRF